MALAFVLLYLAVVYIRPGEILPGWEGFPFAAIAQVIAIVVVLISLAARPRRFWSQPQDRYVLGFFIAAVLSNIAWGWLGGAVVALDVLTPVILCYFLLRGAVRSPGHLRWAGHILAVLTMVQAVNGIVQFRSGVGLGNVSTIQTRDETQDSAPQANDDDDEDGVRRIRGTGIFNDPNDLAMAFVAVVPFLFGPLVRRRSRAITRVWSVASLATLVPALFYTNSRGGMLGLGAALVQQCWRFGRVAGTALATVALVGLLAFGPSRMSQLDSQEESAQGRVQSWSEGLQMFKSRPILGVGFSRYTEYNELVAHNSFVHTLAELGIVGAFCFTGMIYWMFRSTIRRRAVNAPDAGVRSLREWGDDLRSATLGMFICALFLSRQYSFVLFIWIALSACYRQVLLETDGPAVPRERIIEETGIVGVVTVGAVLATYLLVRILALWP